MSKSVEILKKHTDLDPQLVMVGSVSKDGSINLDVSATGNLNMLTLLHHCLGVQLNELIRKNVFGFDSPLQVSQSNEPMQAQPDPSLNPEDTAKASLTPPESIL